MGGLPNPAEAADIWRGIWFEEAHHSTAIEGNTLVLRQVEALLAEGRAVGDKELREYMEVKGYGDAADWVYRQAVDPGAWAGSERLTLSELRQIHRAAMTPVWDVAPHPHATDREGPGSFREHDIEPFPGGMRPPSWPIVASETELWITAVNELRPRAPAFAEDVARLHCRFEAIHPFLDGNGRTGRLVLNLILVRLGYPPAIIYKRQRVDYLRALRRADAGDPGLLGELIARGAGQPLQVRRPGRCRTCASRTARGTRDRSDQCRRVARRRAPWAAPGDPRRRRSMAKQPELGRRLRHGPVAQGSRVGPAPGASASAAVGREVLVVAEARAPTPPDRAERLHEHAVRGRHPRADVRAVRERGAE